MHNDITLIIPKCHDMSTQTNIYNFSYLIAPLLEGTQYIVTNLDCKISVPTLMFRLFLF